MTVALNDGEVVNSCDAITGFNVGNISGDDDFVEGTGAIGLKCSNTTCQMFTTSLGATAPYDFSSSGAEFGFHIIMWFNTKTPINATTGIRFYYGDSVGVDSGEWYVVPIGFYKGGFITKVKDMAADFDVVTGSWTLTGNPAQLTNIDQMGGVFTMTTAIMGNFNNIQLDQFTIGTGLRVDVGTSGSPNTFETVRAADEDTNFWGWWSSSNGQIIGKGKLYIGPASGTTASWFVDTAFAVIFGEEEVAVGFYDFVIRGANTTCTWDLANISSANSASVRWSVTLDSAMGSTTGGFTDTNGVWSGYDTITLNQYASLTGTTLIDGSLITQLDALMDGITLLDADTVSGEHAILLDNPTDIKDSTFTQGVGGHAVRCDAIGTFTWSGNNDSGYTGTRGTNLTPSSGSTDAMFYNNSGGLITLNVAGGGQSPSVRNGASATTQVNATVNVTFDGMLDDTEVRIYKTSDGSVVDGIENATAGSPDDRSFTWSADAGLDVYYIIHNVVNGQTIRVEGFIVPSSDTTIPIQQALERNYSNP